RFGNTNDAGADAVTGIDDLELTFTEVNAAVDITVSNLTRNDQNTPTFPTDDTVDFILTVNGVGSISNTGWTSSSGLLAGTSGPYGVPLNKS
ncbi:hypothetical protein, partial [Campylobacter jejuni]|uniref:hypothetical protein n=1 Tax=Campylobacter jejuni TaxID=197 RepID=UPI001E2D022A